MEKEFSRADVLKLMDPSDAIHEMLTAEPHYEHPIVKVDGKLYWKEVPQIRSYVNRIDLNDLWMLLGALGFDRNSETLRRMYRGMGYSLFGSWEIFHWEVTNELAHEYEPNKNP
jgi:hypothetical protein